MIPDDKLNEAEDIAFAIRRLRKVYKETKAQMVVGNEDIYAEEMRKLAHELLNFCDDIKIRRW